MTLPNFFIIGAAKSGTSSLYMYLKQHPEIYMSPIKEPHYFSFDNVSKHTKGPGDPIHKAITNFDKYQSLFDNVTTEKAIGEASTSYLYRPEAPIRIYEILPEAKFIAILRNPVDRAFSAYMHVVRDKRENTKNFSEALKLESKRIRDGWEPIWHFTAVGYYFQQLSRYFNLFNKNQIKIILYDDLIQHQKNVISNIFQFLEVDNGFLPVSNVHYNVSGKQKNSILFFLINQLLNKPNPIRWSARKLFSDVYRGNFANMIKQINLRKQTIPLDIKIKLIKVFKDDILLLQNLIQQDLSHWLEN